MIIPKTVLGTSDPIDICEGFALFAGNNARALQLGFQQSRTLLQTNPQLLAWRLNIDAGYHVFAGVCGPAFAMRFDAAGQTSGQKITLDISKDETAAGFVFGVQVGLHLNIEVQNLNITFIADGWNSRFAESWNTIVNLRPSIDLDLVEVLRDIALKFFGSRNQTNSKLEKVPKPAAPDKGTSKFEKVTSYGMFDHQKGTFSGNGGFFDVAPSFSIPIDLVPLTKALPIPGNALWVADQALQALWGGFQMGPRFTIAIPVRVELRAITLMNTRYEKLEFEEDTVTGTTTSPEPTAASHIIMQLSEKPGFSITLEFFINVSVCKLFSLDASVPLLDITGLLGLKIEPGPFSHNLVSRIGRGPENFTTLVADEDRLLGKQLEVILEPVESVA
jgi:hypothetical protein